MPDDPVSESLDPRKLDLGPTGLDLAANVRRLRLRSGWAPWILAARLTEAGCPMTRMAIARIESGSRRVTTDELMTMAHVFGVSPLALLLPLTESPDTPVRFSGDVMEKDDGRPVRVEDSFTARDVWEWALGRRSLFSAGTDDPTAVRNYEKQWRLQSLPLWLDDEARP